LALLQSHFERIMSGWIAELGVRILRELEVMGFEQDSDGVDIALSDGTSLRTQYLVGCDGGSSVVRKVAGIEFAGWDPTTCWIHAEVEMTEQPQFGLRGGGGIGPAEGGRVGVTLIEPDVNYTDEPTLAMYTGIWELPVLGEVATPSAVLVRPDGHVAWVGDGTDSGLRDALITWFGEGPE
jgi:3-(3-hydroxy-phenyl)propionate hydroxylase